MHNITQTRPHPRTATRATSTSAAIVLRRDPTDMAVIAGDGVTCNTGRSRTGISQQYSSATATVKA